MIYPDEDMKRWECCDTQVVLANANYYYTKGQVDKKLDEIDGMTEEEVQTMINRSIRTKADKTDVNTLSGQVEDNTEAIANTYTKREVDNAITAATAPVNNTLTAHTANTSVHVTSQEKTYWNNKLDASAYTPTDLSNYYTKQETQGVVNGAVSGKADTSAVTQEVSSAVAPLFGAVEYDSQTQRINFKHDATGQTIAYVDATDFIKDGMVSNVEIINGNLVITFNSDAGKQPISIPLTDIFNPANYYTTAQTQSYVSGFTYDKATIDQKVAEGGTFDPDLYYDKTATDALLAAKADTATTYTKTEVDTALGNKADTSAVTAVANDVQTVSGQVQTKVATSDFNTYTAATATAINGKQDALEYYSEDTSGNTANIHIEDAENSTQGDLFVYGDGAQMTGSRNDSDEGIDYFSSINVAPEAIDITYDKNTGDETTSAHSYLYVNENNISLEVNSNEVTTTLEINDNGVAVNNEAVATEPYVDAATSGKADTSAVTAVSDALTAHTANTTVHVTAAEKAEWDDKAEVIELTQAQYDALVTKDPDVLYVISDAAPAEVIITTTITSSSTNGQVPSAKAVYDQMGGLKLVSLTQAQYDALSTKDASTIYFING